ncbi:MAG: DUF4412 domain-containing protein [Spirochaetota bacterium]
MNDDRSRRSTRSVVSVLAALLVLAAAPAGQREFEGVLTLSVSANGVHNDATVYAKGGMFRIDPHRTIKGQASYLIVDTKRASATAVDRDALSFMTLPLPREAAAAPLAGVRAVKAGTATIAGVACEEWVYTHDERTARLWVPSAGVAYMRPLPKAPLFSLPAERLKGDDRRFFRWVLADVAGRGFFPLKLTLAGERGDLEMEVRSIVERPVDASVFAVPAGYRKKDGGRSP